MSDEMLVRAVEALERATARVEEMTRRMNMMVDLMTEDHQEHVELRELVSTIRQTVESLPCQSASIRP